MILVAVVTFAVLCSAAVGMIAGALWANWRLDGHVRWPRLFDVVRIDKRLHVVISIEYPERFYKLQPLDEMLAQHLRVDDGEKQGLYLGELMIQQGWTPPVESEWFGLVEEPDYMGPYWIHWYDDPHLARTYMLGLLLDVDHAELMQEAIDQLPASVWTRRMRDDLRAGIEAKT